MALGAKRGADRVIAGRAIPGRLIIGAPRVAADATLPGKLSAATQIKSNMRFVFIRY
jgi:hypothetical protein